MKNRERCKFAHADDCPASLLSTDGWRSNGWPTSPCWLHVECEGELGGHVSIAAGLADLFRARLVGVAGWAPMSVFLAQEAFDNPSPGDFHLQDMKTLLDQRGKEFCAALDKPDRRVEWRSILDFPTEAVAREARSADLVIIPAIARSQDPFRALDPGSAILKAGRPVLVVPKDLASLSANCHRMEGHPRGTPRRPGRAAIPAEIRQRRDCGSAG